MSQVFFVGPEGDPDRYALGPHVGAGAEGILYRATITVDSGAVLDVAVKMLHPNHRGRIAEWHRRWTEQVELLRSFQAPGVVGVRDGFLGPLPHARGTAEATGATTLYLVMNWVNGEPLDVWADTHRDASPAELLKLLLPVAGALDLMHSGQATGGTPVIHGDVKPAHILVQPAGEAVLVDFGLVRSLPGGSRLTGVAGTPGYMAPEVRRDGAYTPAADRYALGGVAYFLLTGDDLPPDHDIDAFRNRLASAQSGRPELVGHVLAMLHVDPASRPRLLANWCAQLRNSSLEAPSHSDVLAPVAPSRRPRNGEAARTTTTAGSRRALHRRIAIGVVGFVMILVVSAAVANSSGEDETKSDVSAGERGGTILAVRRTTTSTAPVRPTSTVPETQSTRPGANTPGPTVLPSVTCRNPYVGYELTVPPPFRDKPQSRLVGTCETFQMEGLRPPSLGEGLLADPIVITALPLPLRALSMGWM